MSEFEYKEQITLPRLRIGVSSCLLGEPVRYDGRDKRHSGVLSFVGPRVCWVPVCPELESGFGVPREPVRLTGDPSQPRLFGEESGKDLTDAMLEFCRRRVDGFRSMGLDGFILKKSSPTCGIAGVPVYQNKLSVERVAGGSGIFAWYLLREFPGLPIVDEDAVADERGAADFLECALRFRQRGA